MSALFSAIIVILVFLGLFIMLLGSIGILRLPDFYSRTHAASKVDTLGIIVILIALSAFEWVDGHPLNAVKLGLGVVFVMLANPVAAHALGRAAFRSGTRPMLGDPRAPIDHGTGDSRST